MNKIGVIIVASVVGAALALPPQTEAQVLPLSFELRAGAAIPTGDLDDVSAGFTYGANIAYRILPAVRIYGGYSQADFSADAGGTRSARNFDLGALVDLPVPGLAPWARGGVVFGEYDGASRGTGFEVGGGVAFGIAPMMSLTPGVRFTTFPVNQGGVGNATYITADLGFRLRI